VYGVSKRFYLAAAGLGSACPRDMHAHHRFGVAGEGVSFCCELEISGGLGP